jgi:uncharacterized phage protein
VILEKRPCPDCKGSGIHLTRQGVCDACGGTGRRAETREEAKQREARLAQAAAGAIYYTTREKPAAT